MPNFSARCPHFDTEECPSTLKQVPGLQPGRRQAMFSPGDQATDREEGNASRPIETTLHYENGGVVVEANSLTELFGTLKNVFISSSAGQ